MICLVSVQAGPQHEVKLSTQTGLVQTNFLAGLESSKVLNQLESGHNSMGRKHRGRVTSGSPFQWQNLTMHTSNSFCRTTLPMLSW